ncbi:unnamed protein product [Hapterophycus canaliculatus]
MAAHVQSRERGITLDLGFSSFTVALPGHLPTDQYSQLQFTLVRGEDFGSIAFAIMHAVLNSVRGVKARRRAGTSNAFAARSTLTADSSAAPPPKTLRRRHISQVDCPGHASLIRTIIGGAQIMDMMLLVVDATKGMQAQTTECVVIGEAVMSRGADVIVVLNKVDLIPEEGRRERLRQLEKDIAGQLAGTK